jgi:GTPase SAR1 family protein
MLTCALGELFTSTQATTKMSLHKITVLGTGGVGKTAVTIRLCSNHFVEYYGAL